MKKIAMNVLRAVISFGLLAYLISLADIDKIWATLQNADYRYFGLAMTIFLIVIAILALRWKVLLKQADITPGYWRLVAFYLIGFFFNNFLPTSIGGDVSRAYYVGKLSGNNPAAVASVLLERLLGLLSTLTLASVAVFWAAAYFQSALIIFLTISMFAGVCFVLLALLNKRIFEFANHLLGKITLFGIGEKIQQVLATIHQYRESKSVIFRGYLLSLSSQFLLVVMNLVLAKSLGLEKITLSYLLLVIPITFIISLFPSINGLGVRDIGYQSLLANIGVLPAEALSLSFLNTLTPMIISIFGGILLIFYRNKNE